MLQIIVGINNGVYNKILTILVLFVLLGNLAFAEDNITHDDAYLVENAIIEEVRNTLEPRCFLWFCKYWMGDENYVT